jgi:hypothetical protein
MGRITTENSTQNTIRALPNGRHGGDIEGIIKNLDYTYHP